MTRTHLRRFERKREQIYRKKLGKGEDKKRSPNCLGQLYCRQVVFLSSLGGKARFSSPFKIHYIQ